MRRLGLVALLLLGGCGVTVARHSYACMRVGLTEELDTAERTDPERFREMLAARMEAGTCVALTPGQRLPSLGGDLADRRWVTVTPPGGVGSIHDLYWAPADAME